MYKAIVIDRQNLTIMGVPFSDLDILESTAHDFSLHSVIFALTPLKA